MDIINNPVDFINSLLESNDYETVHRILQSCTNITLNIHQLEINLDKFYYSVQASLYTDSILYANKCRIQFEIYKNDKEKHCIKTLFDKYLMILETIKVKLLTEFNTVKEETFNFQLKSASELLELLGEKERIKFLQDLSDKIVTELPKGSFVDNFTSVKLQLDWIFELPDNKYKLLDKWNFKRFLIESWADRIRDLIINANADKITMKIFRYAREIEKRIENEYAFPSDIIMVAFDLFCHKKIQEIINLYLEPTFSLKLITTTQVYECFGDFFLQLISLNKNFAHFANIRNTKIIVNFFEEKINLFLRGYLEFFKTNFLVAIDNLTVLRDSFNYLHDSANNISKIYNSFSIRNTNIDVIVKEIHVMIYTFYKTRISKLLESSVSSYQVKSFLGLKKNFQSDKEIDISADVYKVGELLKTVSNYEENIKLYLVRDINNFYKALIDINNLANINENLFQQIIMDLYHIKKAIGERSDIFLETENKVKFLCGDILNDKIFVEQFKSFYQIHNLELLKKIIRFKNLDLNKSNNLVKMYC